LRSGEEEDRDKDGRVGGGETTKKKEGR